MNKARHILQQAGIASKVGILVLVAVTAIAANWSGSFLLQSAPYPPSPVITQVDWARTVLRKAPGGDTWPITWADDGHLYTAWGDGHGFRPFVPNKLSLGYARVEGHGNNFNGFNIPSNDEQVGDGQSGKKASGMLMVDGTLYMLVRNAVNNGTQCQLASSTDHGTNWTWSTWTFPELGYCTFINFGQDYAGARDNYVYIVSHDNPSAYQPADSFVLMRVPKAQITDRGAYEFFVALDGLGNPIWNADINQRGPVFEHTGMASRSGISYNPALGRYLWWQQLYGTGGNGVDTRFSGGFGIYDAPEPWGPWTTAYYTDNWDMGPGETASFPTKWMSSDGQSAYLAFSGEDSFSVREATFTLADSTPPSAPTTLGATAVSQSQIDLTWTAASDPESGVSSYNVYRDGLVVGSPSGTSFQDTSLTTNTTYDYQVEAVNGLGMKGPKSAVVSATTLAPVTLEAEPSLNLHQDSADGATGVKIGIAQITASVTGTASNILLDAFQSNLTYPDPLGANCMDILDVREMDFTISLENITNGITGSATFSGFSQLGVAPPANLGHALTRLTGSALIPCSLTSETTGLTDLDLNSISVVPPTLSMEFLKGDTRADGNVSIADALFIAQHMAGVRPECSTTVDTTCLHTVNSASVNQDGLSDKTTITDALFIAQYLVGQRDEYYNTIQDPSQIWPTNGWTIATPNEMGMDQLSLEQARDYALTGGGAGIITRGGKSVMTWGDTDQIFDVKSTTKSIGSAALGLALQDGLLTLDDLAQSHLPDVGTPPATNTASGWLDQITIKHLATQTAGFDFSGGFIDQLYQPGTAWAYTDGGQNWLADVLTVVYGQDLNTLLASRVFNTLGITSSDLQWRSNASRPDTINGIKRREFGSGISTDVDSMARIGYLYLRGGQWDGQNLVPTSFIDQARTSVPGVQGLPVQNDTLAWFGGASDHYGIMWWNNADGSMPNVPLDAYWSFGLFNSHIIVIPSLDIVVARAGGEWGNNSPNFYQLVEPFIEPIAQSVITP